MSNKIITKFESETIVEFTPENASLFEMLEDFVLRNNSEDRQVMELTSENGRKVIKAAGYVGLVQLNNGTQIEIYPKVSESAVEAKKILSRLLSVYLEIPYSDSFGKLLDSPEVSFMEYFISVYVRECMKIMKSGMLSGYTSVEENSTTMQGSIVFSENIRKNLTHRERLYVRHDVFTPDRSENRLMKTTANLMQKLSHDHQNSQNLKKILLFLDDVKLSDNCDIDFANCINTRNSKKYSVILNMCRLFLKSKSRKGFSGKYVSCALLFPMNEIFGAYVAGIVRNNNKGKVVMTRQAGKYLSSEPNFFPMFPDIAVYDKNNRIESVTASRWKFINSAQDIDIADMYRLFACAARLDCEDVYMIYPNVEKIGGLPENGVYTIDYGKTAKLHIMFADPANEDDFRVISSDYVDECDPETDIFPDPIPDEEIPEETADAPEKSSEPEKKPVSEPEKSPEPEEKPVTKSEKLPEPEKKPDIKPEKSSEPEKKLSDKPEKPDNSNKKVKLIRHGTKSKK